MSKLKNRDKVILLFENSIKRNKPYGDVFSFKDISNHLKDEYKKPYQSTSKLLKRLEKSYIIAYFGSTTSKVNMKLLLKRLYDTKWPEYSERVYLYTPKSGNLYKRLLKKFKRKNKKLISEISFLYRVIEVISKFQDMEFYDIETIQSEAKADGIKLSKKEAKEKVTKMRKKVNTYYKDRDKKDKIIRILRFNPTMYYLSIKPVKTDPKEYMPERDFIRNIVTPMINKLKELYKIN